MCNINCRVFDESKVLKDNAMLKVRPELFDEWDFAKNDELGLDVYSVTKGMNKIVWWNCPNCKNPYDLAVSQRALVMRNCPYCASSNARILIGFNDMWTTNPEQARLLANPEDGYKFTEGSSKRVNWKCAICDEEIRNKPIKEVKRRGLACPICSNGASLSERVMYQLLKWLNVEFKMDTSIKWSKGKRYDFYIPSLNMIIEMHGRQHSGDGFETMGGRSLEEEIENDRLKREMATQNGIVSYVEIDARKSDFAFIKDNIISSGLNVIFDLAEVDWNDINLSSQKTFHAEILELWNKGFSLEEIALQTKHHKHTVGKTLKNFEALGKCVSDPRRANNKALDRRKTLVIFQLDKDFNIIKRWNNIGEIVDELEYPKKKTISNSCRENRTAYGFYWKYERDMNQDIMHQ